MAMTEKQMLKILKRPIDNANRQLDRRFHGGLYGAFKADQYSLSISFAPGVDRLCHFSGRFTMKQLEAVNLFMLMKLGPGYLNAR